jgi:hypothetical protein
MEPLQMFGGGMFLHPEVQVVNHVLILLGQHSKVSMDTIKISEGNICNLTWTENMLIQ